MPINPHHYGTAAAGSVRTPLSVTNDNLRVEWCLQITHLQTLKALYKGVCENINWWISISKNILIMPTYIIAMANSEIM